MQTLMKADFEEFDDLRSTVSSISSLGVSDYDFDVDFKESENLRTAALLDDISRKLSIISYTCIIKKVKPPLQSGYVSVPEFRKILKDKIYAKLTKAERKLLEERYKENDNSINFGTFMAEFNQRGKDLYDKIIKIRFQQTVNTVNMMGGLPGDGIMLEDISNPSLNIPRFERNSTYGENQSYVPSAESLSSDNSGKIIFPCLLRSLTIQFCSA